MRKLSVAIVLIVHFSIGFSQNKIDPASIDIVRDRWGVPHIFARTDAGVAYGLAWAHSEDDFQTIQRTVLTGKSMLGQHEGRDGAIIDYVVHFLGIRELVASQYSENVSPSFKAVLQGYCDGLNAYAASHPKQVLVKRSFPVTPQDLLAYSVLQLAIGCDVDVALKKIFHNTIPLADFGRGPLDSLARGSNAFAFNSKKTEDGNVYLAMNTHHPLEGQVAWYEAHLSSEEGLNILGTLFPGSPVVFIGVNENLAWTHTVNHPDKLDVYQLEMNPNNKLEYKVDNEWHTLQENTVKLKVKVPGLNLHVKKKIYKSIYGPTMITDRGVFSLRTPAIMDIRAFEQWHRMNKAKNFHDFRDALRMEAHPGYNIVYADRFDTIYYISNGRMPLREEGYNWKSTVPGNTMRTRWTKFHSIDELPQVLNPASGYVFNANHSPFKASDPADNLIENQFDPTMGYETHDNNRSLRVYELLKGNDRISFEEFKAIKYDLQLPQKLAFPVNIDTLFLLDKHRYPEIADLISTLNSWDRNGNVESKGAAVFGVFFYYVAAKYKADETLKVMTESMIVEGLHYAKDYLLKNFGRTDITLGEYQRLERGSKSLPLPGLPDVLAAMYASPSENGRVKGTIGECYVGLVKFTSAGPEIETINVFGASNRRSSPHYDDQMELFINQKTKKMTLNKESVYRDARSIYHPESLSRLQPTRLNRQRR